MSTPFEDILASQKALKDAGVPSEPQTFIAYSRKRARKSHELMQQQIIEAETNLAKHLTKTTYKEKNK